MGNENQEGSSEQTKQLNSPQLHRTLQT